jgi:hypothetical protein
LKDVLRRIWLKDHDRSGGMADSADPGSLAGIGAESVKCDRDSLDGRAQTGQDNSQNPLLPKR